MTTPKYPFGMVHYLFRKADYTRWHRMESKRHILRSQQGFCEVTPSRPKACIGCNNYHGVAYGTTAEGRTILTCGLHPYPYGWHQPTACPDWGSSD